MRSCAARQPVVPDRRGRAGGRGPPRPPSRGEAASATCWRRCCSAPPTRHRRQRQFAQASPISQRATRGPAREHPARARPSCRSRWTPATGRARRRRPAPPSPSTPRSFEAWQGLGYALLRQDRNREAAGGAAHRPRHPRRPETPRPAGAHPEGPRRRARAWPSGSSPTSTCATTARSTRRSGREILRALERHYATLASALDHQPRDTDPGHPVLAARPTTTRAGRPPGRAASTTALDGRIRIPIGGLDRQPHARHGQHAHPRADPRLRGRPHARRRARATIHEGLAQYMEGKRVDSDAHAPRSSRALADGRIGGVTGFYLGALSFVEYLIAHRGMGGMNELLQGHGRDGQRRRGLPAGPRQRPTRRRSRPGPSASASSTEADRPSGSLQVEGQARQRRRRRRAARAQRRSARTSAGSARLDSARLPGARGSSPAGPCARAGPPGSPPGPCRCFARSLARATATSRPPRRSTRPWLSASAPVQTRPWATASISSYVFLRPSAALRHEVLVERDHQRADTSRAPRRSRAGSRRTGPRAGRG